MRIRPAIATNSKYFKPSQPTIRAADKGDLDDATEGFRQLTTSCVNCHKVVRDVGRTR